MGVTHPVGAAGRLAAGLIAFYALLAVPAEAAGLRKGFAACRDQASLQRLIHASVANDGKTVAAMLNGPCLAIAGHEQARILGRTPTMARLALKGRPGVWWTVLEAVR